MRETMGRYIAELDADGRDRLIAAPEFNDGADWCDDATGCGCLVGTVEGFYPSEETRARHYGAMEGYRDMYCIPWDAAPESARFPSAVERFGKARVVRAIKLRAARLNGCSPEAIAALTAPHEQPQAVLP